MTMLAIIITNTIEWTLKWLKKEQQKQVGLQSQRLDVHNADNMEF